MKALFCTFALLTLTTVVHADLYCPQNITANCPSDDYTACKIQTSSSPMGGYKVDQFSSIKGPGVYNLYLFEVLLSATAPMCYYGDSAQDAFFDLYYSSTDNLIVAKDKSGQNWTQDPDDQFSFWCPYGGIISQNPIDTMTCLMEKKPPTK
jgi:hypothetical protein